MSHPNEVLILVLRREVSQEERTAFEKKFPGRSLRFECVNSRDHLEHAAICTERNPVAVLLPKDRPIPSTAMEHGFAHVTIAPDGEVLELLPLIPHFKPFQPES